MIPLVTVNILSHNRKDELRNTLMKVFAQDYKNIEIIVVDNASSDGSPEMVKAEFSSVQLIQLEKNIGIAGWNEGFKIAKGEYVLVLDDDAYPELDTLHKGIEELMIDPKLGIVAFNIFNSRQQRSETEDFLPNPYFFNGCGALIKKRVIDVTGFFNELIFIYYHELDYSLRCYNNGFSIKYLHDTRVIHNQFLLSRKSKEENPFKSEFRFYHYFISYAIILFQYFPFRYSILYFTKWVINRLIVAVKYNFILSFFCANTILLNKVVNALRRRKVVGKSIRLFYRNGNIPLIDREYFPKFVKPNLWSNK